MGSRLEAVRENIAATDLELNTAELAKIDDPASSIQAEGERYAPQQLAMIGRGAPPIEAEG